MDDYIDDLLSSFRELMSKANHDRVDGYIEETCCTTPLLNFLLAVRTNILDTYEANSNNEFEEAYRSMVAKLEPIFCLLREGYTLDFQSRVSLLQNFEIGVRTMIARLGSEE